MPRGQITTLTRANKTSKSLRTTVPSSVINQFGLKEGDMLSWQFLPTKKGKLCVKLEPVSTDAEFSTDAESTGKNGCRGQ